jgi:hypothetical protein
MYGGLASFTALRIRHVPMPLVQKRISAHWPASSASRSTVLPSIRRRQPRQFLLALKKAQEIRYPLPPFVNKEK